MEARSHLKCISLIGVYKICNVWIIEWRLQHLLSLRYWMDSKKLLSVHHWMDSRAQTKFASLNAV
jgi:hypothetical protein